MTDRAETPRERRARLLQQARAAEVKAREASDPEIRAQLLDIAAQWAMLAEELEPNPKPTEH